MPMETPLNSADMQVFLVQLILIQRNHSKASIAEAHELFMRLKQVLEHILCSCGISGNTERLLALFQALLKTEKITNSNGVYRFPKTAFDLPRITVPVVPTDPSPLYTIIWTDDSNLTRTLMPPAIEAMEILCEKNKEKRAAEYLRDCLFELKTLEFMFSLSRDVCPHSAIDGM